MSFDGRNLTPLTSANGFHIVTFSPDWTYYIDNYSRTDLPNIVELHRASDGSLISEVERGEMSDLVKAGFWYDATRVGCYDNRMDKIIWNEAWMGWPLDESYSASSGVDNAWRLKGHLLMVVGELDENVDPSSTLQVVDALTKARKDFDLIVAPGLGHTALRSSGPVDYGLRRQYDFFLKRLAGVQTPDWNALIDATPPAH